MGESNILISHLVVPAQHYSLKAEWEAGTQEGSDWSVSVGSAGLRRAGEHYRQKVQGQVMSLWR